MLGYARSMVMGGVTQVHSEETVLDAFR
jgi:hypothetical protein